MPESKRPLKVFLCHASADKPKVRELHRYLRRRGIKPWFDEIDLIGGQDWQVEIPKALATSDAIIICLTKNSVDKEGYVQKEIKFALDKALEMPEGRIYLIPVRFEECEVPFSLSRYQWVDLFDEIGFTRLMRSLKTRAGQLERANVQIPKSDDSSLNFSSTSEEKFRLENAEHEAANKAELEAAEKVARDKTEKDALETARLEAEEQVRQKAAGEKAEREVAEKIARDKAEKDAIEKARLEAEELTRQKTAKEKAKRAAVEKAKRERAERQAELTKTLSNFLTALKLALPKAVPFFRIAGFAGIAIALFWVGSWGVPKLASLIPTANASLTPTPRPSATITLTASPKPPAQTATPKPTSTETRIPSPTATLGVGSTMISTKDGMTLLYVPAGEFTMGNNSNISVKYADERPMHKVNVASFWIDQTEVTNEMWALCVQANVCEPPDRYSMTRENYYGATEFADYPVIVSYDWDKAKTYCEWAGRRLPTEAEWEKAARGTDGSTYPWGEGVDCNKANYGNCVGDTPEAGKYPAGGSIYGALDMAGNVWEWVSSLYKTYPYSGIDGREDLNTDDFSRVMRGGSWLDSGTDVRSDIRSWGIPPIDNTLTVGFRCARSP